MVWSGLLFFSVPVASISHQIGAAIDARAGFVTPIKDIRHPKLIRSEPKRISVPAGDDRAAYHVDDRGHADTAAKLPFVGQFDHTSSAGLGQYDDTSRADVMTPGTHTKRKANVESLKSSQIPVGEDRTALRADASGHVHHVAQPSFIDQFAPLGGSGYDQFDDTSSMLQNESNPLEPISSSNTTDLQEEFDHAKPIQEFGHLGFRDEEKGRVLDETVLTKSSRRRVHAPRRRRSSAGLSLAREALAKAKESLSEARKAQSQAEAAMTKAKSSQLRAEGAMTKAKKSLNQQAEDHKRLLHTQSKAEEAQGLAREAGNGSRSALKDAKGATNLAVESLTRAKEIDNHTQRLNHIVSVQQHVLNAVMHGQSALNKTLQKVRAMQIVDESLLNTTNRTTAHLKKVIATQNRTLTVIERLQEVDEHTVNGLNHNIASVEHTLASITSQLQIFDRLLNYTKKETDELKAETKVLKATSWTSLALMLLYMGSQKLASTAEKTAVGIATDKAKHAVKGKMRDRMSINLTVRGSDGLTLFGPKDIPGRTSLKEILSRMPPPPSGRRWDFISANTSLALDTHVHELGEGDKFVLSALAVNGASCSTEKTTPATQEGSRSGKL